MFDQHIHSQSQKRCFKEFAHFWQKIPSTKHPKSELPVIIYVHWFVVSPHFVASKIYALLLHWILQIIVEHCHLNQSNVQRAARNLCVGKYEIFVNL